VSRVPGIRLGLLGHGIGQSLSPTLHKTLGALNSVEVEYTSFDRPASFVAQLPEFLDSIGSMGFSGINVTHPFKEDVWTLVEVDDPLVRAIGAVNTVCFRDGIAIGSNTDYSGTKTAIVKTFGTPPATSAAVLGAGGYGKAAIYALADIGVPLIHLYDPDGARASALAADVQRNTRSIVRVFGTAESAVRGVEGLLNCSPIGMHNHLGCPVDAPAIRQLAWVFDAIYSPLQTQLLRQAGEMGIPTLSGVELLIWQGVASHERFIGSELSPDVVRTASAIVRETARNRSEERSE
jgi:shikimate dehydrogenase